MKVKNIIISLFFILVLIAALFFLLIFYQKTYGHKVIIEVWLGNHNLKGLTKEEVEDLLEKEVAKIEETGIKFYADKKEIILYPMVIALNDPDLTRRIINFRIDQTIENIFLILQKGGILKFLKTPAKQTIQLVLEVNEGEILKILKSNFKELEVSPRDASFKYKAGEWKIIKEENGLIFDYEKAIEELKNNLSNLENKPISLKAVVVAPKIYKKDVEASVKEAEEIAKIAPIELFYGQEKWTVNKETILNWIAFNKKGLAIEVEVDEEKIKDYLLKLAEKINRPIQEAKFKLENGRVTEFQLAREGRKLELETSSQKIKGYLLANIKQIELEVIAEKPTSLTEGVNDLGIKELVGRGESDFKGSPRNRINNIKIGAKNLNGILIKPGEEFSLLKALGEVTREKGYLPELVIKANRTIPELGGGLCQLGTTAFRVALAAGLPITQRTPHAFRVIYYEPAGVDATIYQPSPDFRFINDYQSWLLLQTRVEGTKLIFELYGTNDGRRVELTPPKMFDIVPPGPVKYIETDELAPGEKKLVEKPVAGAKTEFTRTIIYPNGEKKEEIWKSHYRPWPEVWLIGKKPVSAEAATGKPETPSKTITP